MILSVPEGDDKPLKYPLMFTVSDVLLVNKIDYLAFSDFDLTSCGSASWAQRAHPDLRDLGEDGSGRRSVGRLAERAGTERPALKRSESSHE